VPSSVAVAREARGRDRAPGLALLFVASALLIAYGFWAKGKLPELASAHGRAIDATIRYLLIATGILFLIGHGVLAWFVVRYAGTRDKGSPHASSRLEWRWALAPVVVMCGIAEGGVLFLGLPAFGELYGEPAANAVTIEVVGKQFEWLVHHPGPDGVLGKTDNALVNDARNPIGLDKKDPAAKDDIVKRGVLNLPVDRMVVLRLRALDVIHSFTVPQFRVKQDLIPGFYGRTQFTPTRIGTFELACAELCGLGHYRMQGSIVVQSEADYEKWVNEEEPWF